MLEKQIEARVCQYAKDNGFLVYKFTSPARAAVPDRLLIRKGLFFFIEFKATGKTPTPAQLREHKRLEDAGARVYVIDSIESGIVLIDHILLTNSPWLG